MIEKPGGTRTVRFLAGALAVAWAWGLRGEAEFDPRGGVLIGYDVLCKPGERVLLKGRLWRKRILLRGVMGRKIEFFLGKELIGEARTDREGLATLPFRPEGEEDYFIRVVLAEREGLRTDVASLLVSSRQVETRTAVLDIDGTLAQSSVWLLPFRSHRKIRPLPGAIEAVWALARRYAIIYLTGRDDSFLQKTKEWLEMHAFPRAPVFFWDPAMRLVTPAVHKMLTIKALKKEWPNLVLGIGDRPSDALAYLSGGIKAYIVGTHHRRAPEGAAVFRNWAEVSREIGLQERTRSAPSGRGAP